MAQTSGLNTRYAYRQLMNSIKNAKADIEDRIQKLLVRIAKDTTQRIKEYVLDFFYYQVPDSNVYDRLGEMGGFLGTITYEIDSKNLSIRIYCDWNKLKFISGGVGKLPHHIDVYTGERFTEGLYDYIMYGEWNRITLPNSILNGFDGISEELQREINDWLNDYLTTTVVNALEREGIRVKIINKNIQILGKI